MTEGRKTGGRQKGIPNKRTAAVKDVIEAVFHNIGGEQTFADWAVINQTEFYKIYAKLLPAEMKVKHEGLDGLAVRVSRLPAFNYNDDEESTIDGE
jgi:hypothetical protein